MGGQLMLTTEVENFPGFKEGILGPDLMDNMRKQAERFGAEMIFDDATAVDFSSKPFKVWVGSKVYEGKSVIIATEASSKWLGLESEARLRGRVSPSVPRATPPFSKTRGLRLWKAATQPWKRP
jgi:thioredoxin reductase (NADPH)